MKKTVLFLLILSTHWNTLSAQSLYDSTAIQRIDIFFSASNWDYMLDTAKAGSEGYIMADSVAINGVLFDSVGVKYKGNSTYQANQTKNPWHIELDTYKKQDYQGYKDIKLSNVKNDPSFLREVLSYEIARKYMEAPQSNYAVVYVNGSQIGLYSNSEAISKTFVGKYLFSKTQTFIKCNPPAGAGPGSTDYPNLVYLGNDSADYYASYELKSDAGWLELIHLTDTLKNHTSQIETMLNVDQTLWMHAFNNALVNLDSYSGAFAQNYYLYRMDNGQFYPIIWDLNESIGRFSMTGTSNLSSTTTKAQMTHLLHSSDTNWPLIQELLSVPLYKRMYLAHLKTIVSENLSNGQYYIDAQFYHNLIDSAVNADPNNLSTYTQFSTNLTSDVTTSGGGPGGPPGGSTTPGIKALLDARATHLLATSDLSAAQPQIAAVSATPPTSLPGSAQITAQITGTTDVYLSFRTTPQQAFQRIQMFDDGQHGDGAANDGTFGATVPMTGVRLQYFIYADGTTLGAFSPARAAHNFHTLNWNTGSSSLVINELMASNDATIAASDGEYYDWIELYNASNEPIYLGDYGLSDDLTDPTKYILPADSLQPGGFTLIWASDQALPNPYHAPFKLSKSGEELALFHFPNTSADTADYILFTAQTTDISFGRSYDASPSWITFNTPTPNASNGTLGLPESPALDLMLYPNPHSGHFTVQNPNASTIYMTFYSLQGQPLHQCELSPTSQLEFESPEFHQPLIIRYSDGKNTDSWRLLYLP